MKRFIVLLTAVLFLLFAVGCENVEYIAETSNKETSTDIYESLNSKLPDYTPSVSKTENDSSDDEGENGYIDFDHDRVYTIVTNEVKAFGQDEESSGTISLAIEDRNLFLKQKYGVDVAVKQASQKQIADGIKKSLESGTEYCDLISISGSDTVSLYLSDLLCDMNTLPDFDPKSEFFDEKCSTALATNSTLYMLADPTALVYDKAYVLFYNRKLLENTSAPDPDELAVQGKWTWDVFNTCVKQAAAEVYRKASADLETDIYGFSSNYLDYGYTLAMWYSSGNKLIGDTYKNDVALSASLSEISSIAKGTSKYYNVKGRYPFEGAEARTAFENNRLAFLSNRLEYLYSLRDGTPAGEKYGFLPMPKYSEEQESYACLLDSSARVFAIPKTAEKLDEDEKRFAGIMLSAICAVGRATIKDAYVSSNLALYLYNNNETLILQTITDSIVFDFANVFGSKIDKVAIGSTRAVNNFYTVGSSLTTTMDRYISQFESYSKTKFT